MPSIIEVYCVGFFVASAVALPTTVTILQGPWNSPETLCSPGNAAPIPSRQWDPSETATPMLAIRNQLPTSPPSSISSVFLCNAYNSSSPMNASSNSSSPAPSKSLINSSSSTSFRAQQSSFDADSSSRSMTPGFSSSFAGSAGRRSLSDAGNMARPLSSSSRIVSSPPHPLSIASTSYPASSLLNLEGRNALGSTSATRPIHPTGSSRASASIHTVPSAASKPVSAAPSISTSTTSISAISIINKSTIAAASPSMNPCGMVAQYYNPTPNDWTSHNTDAWLVNWIDNHILTITANVNGFAGAFATWAIGNPDFSCRDNGSPTNCDFNPCNIAVLNAKGSDVRPTYYVMESMVRLHTYFTGLREAFTISSIAAALSKDGWAATFYVDHDNKAVLGLRESFNGVAMVVGITCALAGVGGLVVGTTAGIAAAIYGGAAGAVLPLIGQHADDTYKKSSDLGLALANIIIGSIQSFTTANDILMHGQTYHDTGDLRSYLRGGNFVNYPGIDKNTVTGQLNGFLIGQAINSLYRQQKIFILGGGNCGDNQGIGQGPQDGTICRDGKAWYLYWWQEPDHFTLNMHQLGWVTSPPGADKLGKGDYAAVTIQDILNSSLDAYIVAGYNYDNITAYQRAQSALKQQWANPAAQGTAWEGIFSIPVCNISAAINGSPSWSGEYILQPYGHESRPVWCGPICDGNITKTRAFIHAANMENFESPVHFCDNDNDRAANWWVIPPG